MATKIRLQRHGDKKRPYYHIVAANSAAPRDGKFLEKLGTYNPMLKDDDAKRIVVNAERAAYWLGCGAQPTERVAKFFSKLNIAAAKTI